MTPAALVTGEPYLTGDIMSFVTGALYLVIPIVWLTLLGWSGYNIGGALATLVDTQTKATQAAGATGGAMARNLGARAAKHLKG